MYVCNCNGINEYEVKARASRCGQDALCELKKECGLGNGCGQCIKHAKTVIETHKN
jgi:bacterioferritin-associated ferredoxin